MDFSEKGVYCLIFENQECKLEIGKKGEFLFSSGFHVYVGSALGPGGLKRVKRHLDFSKNKDRKPRWHVDYLHLSPSFRLVSAVCAPTLSRFECELANRIGGTSILGFGCTDCTCRSHLFYRKGLPIPEITEAFENLGLSAFLIKL
jgi:Uri superfamily endonuclease